MSQPTSRLSTALAERYKIISRLGEGGMATVYLAEDLKHQRKVALKVLRPELAAVLGAERFVQEITTTANLQHPHILPLFDSGEADSFLYYVMPYIDGETLRDKLDRETQLGIDEAVKITVDIADALDYAHRQGIIHRDIKPENILLHDGRPMVADFGIALAVSAAAGGRMTETGLSLGTPHYMSPEQATAEKDLTTRADIYSLGSVLYEMLTGEPPHMGNSAQAIIMKIVTDEARPVTELRKSVPPHVAAAVAKSVEKLPADRFETAADFAAALRDTGFTLPATRAAVAAKAGSSVPWKRLAIGLAAALVVVSAFTMWQLMQPEPVMPVSRYSVRLPVDRSIGGFFARIALTPDGSKLIYSSGQGGQANLFSRERDQLEPAQLAGTLGALSPFVSPDGTKVGFFAAGELRVISLRGGPPVMVADTLVGGAGATWSPDGFIYADGQGQVALVRVLASGGRAPEWFTTLDSAAGETDHVFPSALPNGRGVLFEARHGGGGVNVDIAVASTATGTHRILVRGLYPRYAGSGHLLYVSADGSLMAAPFDQNAMELTGDPVALVGGIRLRTIDTPDLAIADDGTLMYTVGGAIRLGGAPVWVERDGTAEPVAAGWTVGATNVALSPDGTQLAATIFDGGESHLWVRHLLRGTVSKLSFQGGRNIRPSWTPDGTGVLFSSDRVGNLDLFVRRADGTADAEVLVDRPGALQEGVLTRDGEWIVYREGGGAGANLYARRAIGDTTLVPLATTGFQETAAAVSPDGRWLAYVSNETGGSEVYVRPFPEVQRGKWLISVSGGQEPVWSRDGEELFYRNGDGDMVSVEVLPAGAPPTGQQRVLFSASPYAADVFHHLYDVSLDGSRFLMIRQVDQDAISDVELIVVENFFRELRERVGG